jgi:hypothetical protein
MQAEAKFHILIEQLKNQDSDQSKTAASWLHIQPVYIPVIIDARMKSRLSAFINIMNAFDRYEDTEREFAKTVGLDPELWVNYVTAIRAFMRDEPARPEQREANFNALMKWFEDIDENNALFIQMATGLDVTTHALKKILSLVSHKLKGYLLKDEIDEEQLRYAHTINELLEHGELLHGTHLNPNKWLCFMNLLHDIVHYPIEFNSHFEHYAYGLSRVSEPSTAPHMTRPTPFAIVGRGGQDIDGSHNFDQIKAHIHEIISDGTTRIHYKNMISAVLGNQITPITPDEYEKIFGGAYSANLIPAYNILLESFQSRFHDPLINVEEAFQFACRAYLLADPRTLSELERSEPNPKRLYVIARLMRHFITKQFDRNKGVEDKYFKSVGGKKSRSKKRGLHRRKSIHRRKKSIRR